MKLVCLSWKTHQFYYVLLRDTSSKQCFFLHYVMLVFGGGVSIMDTRMTSPKWQKELSKRFKKVLNKMKENREPYWPTDPIKIQLPIFAPRSWSGETPSQVWMCHTFSKRPTSKVSTKSQITLTSIFLHMFCWSTINSSNFTHTWAFLHKSTGPSA